jgi:hypothetical protein
MKLMDIITENHKYEYGCVMLYFDFPEINILHLMIDDNDVYHNSNDGGYGLETEPHTTLLFGLHPEVTDMEVKQIIGNHLFGPCRINNASLFENEEYDVLKFDVSGEGLHECNSDLRNLPHTTNYPDYHPHLTIGYLKPGMGNKYVDMIRDMEHTLIPQYGVYSKVDGSKNILKLKK